MKRLICTFLIIASILCLNGCLTETNKKSVNFYYVRNAFTYGEEDGVIVSEKHSTADVSDPQKVLDIYFKGPQDTSLVSPFPDGTEILEFVYKGETLYITLSSHIVALSKARQVLACTCLGRTAMELTGVKAVNFQSDSSIFTRMDPITIDSDSFLLYDNYTSTPSEE